LWLENTANETTGEQLNMAYHTHWLNCQPTENTAEQPSGALSAHTHAHTHIHTQTHMSHNTNDPANLGT